MICRNFWRPLQAGVRQQGGVPHTKNVVADRGGTGCCNCGDFQSIGNGTNSQAGLSRLDSAWYGEPRHRRRTAGFLICRRKRGNTIGEQRRSAAGKLDFNLTLQQRIGVESRERDRAALAVVLIGEQSRQRQCSIHGRRLRRGFRDVRINGVSNRGLCRFPDDVAHRLRIGWPCQNSTSAVGGVGKSRPLQIGRDFRNLRRQWIKDLRCSRPGCFTEFTGRTNAFFRTSKGGIIPLRLQPEVGPELMDG